LVWVGLAHARSPHHTHAHAHSSPPHPHIHTRTSTGYISFSLYIWHISVIFSLGCWTFNKLYVEQSKSYAHAVGGAAGATLAVVIPVAYVATKAFDEPSVDEKNRVHRTLRRAET
jgi:peptidoglycan/LPS O-acetylase OafA/YrhL